MKLDTEIVVDRPIEEVFAAWADLERSPEWAAPVIERRKVSDGPLGVGTRFHAIDQFPGRRVAFDLEITAYEPHSHMAATWFKPMEGGWDARFSDAGGGTHLAMHAEMRPTGLMRLLSPVMAPWAKRQMRKDLQAFKAMLEAATG
jgi:uncharacterized membrane protein